MNTTPVTTRAFVPDPATLLRRQTDFSNVLARARGTQATPEERARDVAEQYVAVTLVQPILKQARESRSAEPPFGQSEGEREFGAISDAMVAQQMVKSSHWPLVDRLAHDMLKHSPASRGARGHT